MPAIRILLALLICASVSLGGELQTLSGKVLTGEVVSLSEKEVVFKTATGQVTTPVNDILQIELQREGTLAAGLKYTDIELADGSVLHCTQFAIKGKDVEVTLAASNIKAKVALGSIASFLNEANDAAVRKEWQEKIVSKRGNQDVLAVKVNDVVNGLDGTFGDSGNAKGEVPFEYEVGGQRRKRDLDPTKPQVQGLLFLRSLPSDAPAPLCKVFDMHQGTLVASKVAMTATGFTVTTVAGAKFEFPRQAIARLDYSNDKVVFLSDMKPVELIEKSKQGRKETMKLNKNLDNGSLQLEEQFYSKGLAIHAHTEVTYNLEGKYQRFDAVLGMDALVGGEGKSVVTIEADGNKLFSQTVTRKDKRRDLSFPVKGVRQLRIVVTSEGLFDFGAHVDLANAKLSK
jgi:hypothetical protein